MTIKLSSIKNDIKKERDGAYIDIPDWPGVSLGVRSLELPAYKLAVEQLGQRYARLYKGKAAPIEVRESDVGGLVSEHILFGWNGFDEAYSPEFAADLLTSAEGRDLLKQAIWAASTVANTEVQFVADAIKN